MQIDIVRSSKRKKSISIEVNENAVVVVRAPKKASLSTINELLVQHLDWINTQIDSIKRHKKLFIEDEAFLYLGVPYKLKIVEKTKYSNIEFNGMYFYAPRKKLSKELFVKWYKKRAKQFFENRVSSLAKEYGFSYNTVRITNAKYRWGSCSTRKNLSFSWRLIMAPPDIIDYVIVHELAHTVEPNHSKNFWKLLEKAVPNYKIKRRWLNRNRYMLNI